MVPARFGDGREGDGLTFTSGTGSSPVSMTECSRIVGHKLSLGVIFFSLMSS